MNSVCLVGRLTADPNSYSSQNGKNIAKFSLAVQRNYKDKNGECGVDFINCVAYGYTANYILKYIKKGYMLSINGEIQTNRYEAKDGTTKTSFEIHCNQANNLTPKEQYGNNYQNNNNNSFNEISENDLPF